MPRVLHRRAEPLAIEALRRFPELDQKKPVLWLVGGTVRDLALGREPADADLACRDAEAVARQFARTIGGRFVDLGRDRFVTLRVVHRSRVFDFSELTGGAIEIDLQRRDFTLNAVALDPVRRILFDPFDGLEDLSCGVLRMVCEENLSDDPLRILRGARMVAQFDLEVEPETLAAMRRHGNAISGVAGERVHAELTRLLRMKGRAAGLATIRDSGLDGPLFGGLDDQAEEILRKVADEDAVSGLAVVLRERSDAEIESVAEQWRWPKADRRAVRGVVGLLRRLRTFEGPDGELAVLLHDAGEPATRRAVPVLSGWGMPGLAARLRAVMRERGDQIFEVRPALDGREMQQLLGIPAGPELGRLQRELLEAQIRGEVETRDEAVSWLSSRRES